ncbi:MAG: ribonuclease R [Bacteroidetes bacterium]|nr:MAG: ribonuclease R [Bacteroidota bacterium]PTM08068.1 MAG: ribonuclease R [Bacteroidota bacterium]
MSDNKKPKVKGNKLSARDLEREVSKLFSHFSKKQFNPRQVIQKLRIANNKDAVQQALDNLVAAKTLVVKGDFKYQYNREFVPPSSGKTAEGRVDMTRTGAAYIVIEGQEDDIYVAAKNTKNALNGDRVKIRFWTPQGRRKPEGEVVEIIERSNEHFVGILHLFARFGLVSVEGRQAIDFMVSLDELKNAQAGDMVVVRVVERPDSVRDLDKPFGEIMTVLGKPGSSSLDMQAILINNGFNIAFPEEVNRASEALSDDINEAEIARRRDFRDTLTFTIDPLTAKDFDDALSYRVLENGEFEVGVHIADVSHYVQPDSVLDKEAYQRSTSVYLVDRVCPMLPERISNELCSLRPHEDKLTFSAAFIFDQNFKVKHRWFGKGIIHSDRRFTYEEAQEVLETGTGDHVEPLQLLNRVAKKLAERRFQEGSIDFDSEEVRFRLDEDGTPLEVYVKERKDSNRLVEDFMLLANREVATFIANKEKATHQVIPFVYRVHDEPDPDKAMELALFASALGFTMDVSTPQAIAKSYNLLTQKAENDPALKMLAPLAIRTMAKAVYTSKNIGHYGLGFENYSHFTSPIRRYSDVLTHRILEKNLPTGSLYQVNGAKLEEQCKHISAQERKATDAERESIKYKQVEFLEKHVGEDFAGIVNGISEFGIFIELKESHCEGMISFDQMDQSYDIGDGRLSIRGRRTGKTIRMGDELTVKVLSTDLKRRRIDMAFVDGPVNEERAAFIPAKEKAGGAKQGGRYGKSGKNPKSSESGRGSSGSGSNGRSAGRGGRGKK